MNTRLYWQCYWSEPVTTDGLEEFAQTPEEFDKEMNEERPLFIASQRRESFSSVLTRNEVLSSFYGYFDEAHIRKIIPETIREIYNEWADDNTHLDTTLIVVKYVVNSHYEKGWDTKAGNLIGRTKSAARSIMNQFTYRLTFRIRRKTRCFPYNQKYVEDVIKNLTYPIL